jgi:exopolysaccharide production protein ExoQ
LAQTGIRVRQPGISGAAPFGFERVPLVPFATLMIFGLCASAFGPLALLMQVFAYSVILLTRWRQLPAILLAAAPFLLLPLFAIASALWSDVPSITARYGVQLLITVLMGVTLARVLELRQLLLAVFIGVSLACLVGLASGRTGASETGPVLIGLAGSKNQISYFALFWIGAALCVLASSQHRVLTRLLAVLALVPAAFLLVQGDSMTAVVSALVIAALLLVLAVAHWIGPRGRVFALGAAGLLAIPALVALPQIEEEAARFRSDVLHKDARLTGRTLLWESADRLIEQKPLIGHGYKAIWLGREGKGLLARNQQKDGRAFHFHDTFRELRADLGLVGLLLFLVPVVLAMLRSVPLLLARIDAPRAFAIVTLLTILLRVRTELVVGPFLLETVLLYTIVAALLALPLRASDHTNARGVSGRTHVLPRPRSQPRRNPA